MDPNPKKAEKQWPIPPSEEKPKVHWLTRFFGSDMYRGDSAWLNTLNWFAAVVGILGLVATLLLVFGDWQNWGRWPKKADWVPYALPFWAILPPLWFWLDFHLFWKYAPEEERPELAEFKHSQDLGRNVWIALVGLLVAYFKL